MVEVEKWIGECDSCEYRTEVSKYPSSPDSRFEGEPMTLCDLCARTGAGNAHENPELHPDRSTLWTICYVGNAILEALNEKET